MASEPPPRDGSEASGALAGVGRHALVYGAGMVLGKLASFLLLPVYTRALSPADFGVMALVEMTLDVVAMFGGSQVALGLFRFHPIARSEAERRGLVSTAFILLSLGYIGVGIPTVLLAVPLSELVFGTPDQAILIRVAALNLSAQSLFAIPLAWARIRDWSLLFVKVNLIRLGLGIAFNLVALLVLDLGVLGIFLSSLCVTLLVGTGLGWWVVRENGWAFERHHAGPLLRYGLPLVAMQFATFVATFGDRYVLQAAGGEAEVGIYDLAYRFGFLLAVVGYWPFEQVWGPRRFRIAQEPDPGRPLAEGFLLANVWLIGCALGCSLFAPEVLRTLTTPEFHRAAPLVHPILLAYVLQSWAGMQDIGILVRERTAWLAWINWVSAVVAVAGYALLIPRYLGTGAAIATVLAFGCRWLLTWAGSQRLWPVRYPWGAIGRLGLFALACGVPGLLIPPETPLAASLALRTLLLAGFPILVWTGGILSATHRLAIRSGVGSLGARAHGAWSMLGSRRAAGAGIAPPTRRRSGSSSGEERW